VHKIAGKEGVVKEEKRYLCVKQEKKPNQWA
jgi:hypothetical protein